MISRRFLPAPRLRGTCTVPGDKSISHRALLLAALAAGPTRLTGLGTGDDVAATARLLQTLGMSVQFSGDEAWVQGGGLVALLPQPRLAAADRMELDCGNSGTTMRLCLGLLAALPGLSVRLVGDASLSQRPMRRVATPLQAMGAKVTPSPSGTPPVDLVGQALHAAHHRLLQPSAQVKSALLLAGLHAQGTTRIDEPEPCRDHTERMLIAMAAPLAIQPLVPENPSSGSQLCIQGQLPIAPSLRSLEHLHIPGDASSAAVLVVAAVLHRAGDITVTGVGLNPTRLGLVRALQRMGADIDCRLDDERAGEPVGRLHARASCLQALDLTTEEVPALVDEVPLLALCAAAATGTSVLRGLGELRVKESDRLAGTCALVRALGAEAEVDGDTLIINGLGTAGAFAAAPRGPVRIDAGLDHRMALAAAVAGTVGAAAVEVAGWDTVASSFPGFAELLARLTV